MRYFGVEGRKKSLDMLRFFTKIDFIDWMNNWFAILDNLFTLEQILFLNGTFQLFLNVFFFYKV